MTDDSITRRGIRNTTRDWGDRLQERLEKGDAIEMFTNTKRPGVRYFIAIAREKDQEAIPLKTMEAGA